MFVSAPLRTYWRLFVAGFRQQSTYRLAALAGLVANTTFGFLKVAILFATVEAAGGQLRGYDLGAMSAYIWLSQGMLGSVNLHGRSEIAARIKNGDVAVDFIRPVSVQGASIATEVGAAVFSLIPRGLPSVGVGLIVGMSMPHTPGPYLLGVLSIGIGIVVSFATGYLVSAAGFWLIETRGVRILYLGVAGFLCGLFVPISLMPDWLRLLAELTPFPSMMMYPIDILSGRVTGDAAFGLVGQQLGWLVATALIGQSLTRAGRRRLEVQGG